MNIHVPSSVVIQADRAAQDIREGLAFFSIAKTQRVIAGQYRVWAREAEAEGKLEQYCKYAKEARRTFRAAKWHLQLAKDRLHG